MAPFRGDAPPVGVTDGESPGFFGEAGDPIIVPDMLGFGDPGAASPPPVVGMESG